MLWKSLSLGKLVFIKIIFLVPQLWKIAILSLMMIPNLQYMMITMMNMVFSVHLLLSRKLIVITICLLYLMIMVMRITMIAIVEFAPTTINKNDFAYVESNNHFMHVANDKNILCYSYIADFIHDATESYYERGKHGLMHLKDNKFPLFMKILKLHLFCFPMLVA